VTGALALFAPAPPKRDQGIDRVTLHKIGMFVAAGLMATQGILGAVTAGQEGRVDQVNLARAHQVIGYVTLAAVLFSVSVLAF